MDVKNAVAACDEVALCLEGSLKPQLASGFNTQIPLHWPVINSCVVEGIARFVHLDASIETGDHL